jgi:DNA-directed RNA polymerase specialized sigma24 family protein
MPRPKQEWQLTTPALESLLQKIENSPALARGGYTELHSRLVRLFEWRGCLAPDEAADETLDRAMRKIEQGVHIPDVRPFIWGIANNVLKEYKRRSHRLISLELTQSQMFRVQDVPDGALNQCLAACFERLPSEARLQLLEYVESKDRANLASRYGSTLNALRIRISRLRDRLRECALQRCAALKQTPSLSV